MSVFFIVRCDQFVK